MDKMDRQTTVEYIYKKNDKECCVRIPNDIPPYIAPAEDRFRCYDIIYVENVMLFLQKDGSFARDRGEYVEMTRSEIRDYCRKSSYDLHMEKII